MFIFQFGVGPFGKFSHTYFCTFLLEWSHSMLKFYCDTVYVCCVSSNIQLYKCMQFTDQRSLNSTNAQSLVVL